MWAVYSDARRRIPCHPSGGRYACYLMRLQEMEAHPVVVRQGDLAVTAIPLHMEFASFYERELSPVIGLAFVLSGSRSGAEDLAQEAFTKAYMRWQTVGSYDNPGAWVRRVVANASVSQVRRRKAEAKALARISRSRFTVPDMSPDAVATWAAVRNLPKRQAQVIALRYYDRSSIADIGRILGCSENTVKTHLRRAKQALEPHLDEREGRT